MTEDEARQKWCPFAQSRFLHLQREDVESWTTMTEAGRVKSEDLLCIASDCMAWRWEYDSEYLVFVDNNGNRFEANTVGRLMDAEEKNYKRWIPEVGYCGLAGKP